MRETILECPVGRGMPTLHHSATRFLELRCTRLRCSLRISSRFCYALKARLMVRGLPTKRGTVDAIPNGSA